MRGRHRLRVTKFELLPLPQLPSLIYRKVALPEPSILLFLFLSGGPALKLLWRHLELGGRGNPDVCDETHQQIASLLRAARQ
jgi:hypothetical protein